MKPLLSVSAFSPSVYASNASLVKPSVRFSGRQLTHDEGEELNEFLRQYPDQPLLSVDEERALAETIRDFRVDLSKAMAKRWLPKVKASQGRGRTTEAKLAEYFQIGSKELADLLRPEFLQVSGTATEAAALGYNMIEGGSEYMIRYLPQLTRENLKVLVPAQSVNKLAKKAVVANHAAHEMVNRNILLAVSVTKKKLKVGIGFMDLLQDAVVGMMRAVEKFEVDRGWKFATYATWWLKQAVGRPSMTDLHHISIPAHIVTNMPHYNVANDRLEGKLGRSPSPQEIIADLAEHPIMVGKKKDRVFMLDEDEILTIQAAQRVNMRASIRITPFNGGDDGEGRSDFYSDTNQCPADALTIFDDRRDAVDTLLKGLTYREREVIKWRFGLGEDRTSYTLKEIGEQFLHITRERVRQIESKALGKLIRKYTSRPEVVAKFRQLLFTEADENLD